MANTKPPTHPLITKLGVDPNKPTDHVALVGYIGPAVSPDRSRIYHDLSCRAYTEVADADIVGHEPLSTENANSPSLVLLKAGASVQTVHSMTYSTDATFLQGSIADTNLPSAAALRTAVPGTSIVNSNCC
jgi:hypothetical protein